MLIALSARWLPTFYQLAASAALLHSWPISMPLFFIASHFTLEMETAWTSETFVSYHNAIWHPNPELNLNVLDMMVNR
jgi:hypothetical protein